MKKHILTAVLSAVIAGQALAAPSFYLVAPLKRTEPQAPQPSAPAATDPVVNPQALKFAPIQLGDAAEPQLFSLTNTGPLPVDLTGFRLLGNSPYTLMAPCTTLQPEQSCDAYVYLDTGAAGTFPDTLKLEHTGPSGESSLALSADVRAPAGTLPAQTDFGPVSVGSAKDVQLQLKNTGVGRLSVSSLGSSAVTGPGFSFVGSTCQASLPVDGSCNITVRMTGTQPAEQVGRLSVVTGAGTLQAVLRGVGQQSDLVFSSGPVAPFNKVNVGESLTSAAVTLTNSGNVAAQDIALGTTSDSYQIVDSTCSTALTAGANCTFKVKFTPQSAGTKLGELTASSAGQVGATSPLSGVGASAALLLSPSTFNATTVVGASRALNYTVTNTGPSPVDLLGLDVSHALGDMRIQRTTGSNACGAVLAGNSTCTYHLTLNPVSRVNNGALTARLSTSNGDFVDTGVMTSAAWATLRPNPLNPSLAFGNVNLGESATSIKIKVTNESTYITNSTLTYGIPEGFELVDNSCGTISIRGTTCEFVVKFSPTAAKAYSGNITLTTQTQVAGATPFTLSIPVAGTGVAPATLGWTGGALDVVEAGSSRTTKVSLYNPGASAISLSGLTLTGNTAEFSLASTTCAASLGAKTLCSATVLFKPAAAGARPAATLSVNAGGTTVSKSLNATAGAAVFKGSVASLAFATRYRTGTGVSDAFHDLTLTVSNTGTSAAEALSTSISYDQANSGLSFSFENNSCVNRLSAGASCSTRVRAIGSKVGSWSGKVRIASHSGELLVPFTYTTIAPDVDITQTTPMQDAKVGEAFVATYTVQLKPTGRLTVSIPKITGNTSEYSLASGTTCNGTAYAPSSSCVIKVIFTPSEAGQRPEATLTTTIGGIPRTVNLNAKGL